MLLALVGVTGVGKTYFCDEISRKFNFKKVNTIRTRKIRKGEENKKVGLFMTEEEIEKLSEQGKIAYKFKGFSGEYAYLKEEIFSNDNMIFEMHYTNIYDWKKIKPDIKTIYIIPTDINVSKQKLKERNLSKDLELERLEDIDEQYNIFSTDKEIQNCFDYIVYNNYDEESKQKIFDLVEKLLAENI